ncbi:hypothetical protein [Staphylococcus sp. GDX8P54P]|uniref:hypothetical protein n=1 Tax=Staphylococcus sp. GDX8P54P TaxID=2804099 RepID=UPI001AEC4735|nr:hypothetical protein [Staphylococcus sp. GDX8P54P]
MNKEIKLSYEIEGNLYDVSKERDELINDMAEVKRKAEAFDEIKVNLYHVKDLEPWETLDAKDHKFLRDIFNEIPSDWERGSDEKI